MYNPLEKEETSPVKTASATSPAPAVVIWLIIADAMPAAASEGILISNDMLTTFSLVVR